MGILHIIHRVVRRLPLGQLNIEVHLAVSRTGQKEETAGIRAYLLYQLPQRHNIASPLGCPHYLLPPPQGDELVDYYLQLFRVTSQGLHHRLHSRDMPLVVRAPDINHQVELPLQELVVMVGNIRGEIGGRAIALHQHIVLVFPQ